MDFSTLIFLLIALSGGMYFLSCWRVRQTARTLQQKPQSLLRYYGQNAVIWVFMPTFCFLLLFAFFQPIMLDAYYLRIIADRYPDAPQGRVPLLLAQTKNIAAGLLSTEDAALKKLAEAFADSKAMVARARTWLVVLLGLALSGYVYWKAVPQFRVRESVEKVLRRLFFIAACIAIFTTIAIVASLLLEAVRFFRAYPIFDFLTGLHWSPNIALRADQAGSSGSFGMIPVLAGTLLIALIAMSLAVPIGLFAAIYMSEFAHPKFRNFCKPTLEILAGIPTVVYGFFAALTAAPFFRSVGLSLGLDVSAESALAAGAVMGIMIIPFISSLSDDVIRAVPRSLRDAALGLGATRAEMVTRVLLPAAFPGLVGAFLLAISRAIGETMIVVMAVGTAANLTFNPLESVTTVTVQIVGLLTGDTVFDSPKTLSAFALGMTLFVITLGLNIAALALSRRIAERYE